jgi:hypothetical protein
VLPAAFNQDSQGTSHGREAMTASSTAGDA